MTLISLKDESRIHRDIPSFKKGTTLFKIVAGIQNEWELTGSELAILVNKSEPTISNWKRKQEVQWGGGKSNDDLRVLEFLGLYADLTTLFAEKSARVSWLREPNEGFKGKSPLQLIEEDPRNLIYIRHVLSRLGNP